LDEVVDVTGRGHDDEVDIAERVAFAASERAAEPSRVDATGLPQARNRRARSRGGRSVCRSTSV